MSIFEIAALDHYSRDEDCIDLTFAVFIGSIISENEFYLRLECWWVWMADMSFNWSLHQGAFGVHEINVLKRCIMSKKELKV